MVPAQMLPAQKEMEKSALAATVVTDREITLLGKDKMAMVPPREPTVEKAMTRPRALKARALKAKVPGQADRETLRMAQEEQAARARAAMGRTLSPPTTTKAHVTRKRNKGPEMQAQQAVVAPVATVPWRLRRAVGTRTALRSWAREQRAQRA